MGEADAQLALFRLTGILEDENLPYAIIGAFALNEYGHRRVTVDVDLVMRDEDLQAFKRRHLGKGYEERVPGSGKLFDSVHGVNIDVLREECEPFAAQGGRRGIGEGDGLGLVVARESSRAVREKFLELWRLAQVPDPF